MSKKIDLTPLESIQLENLSLKEESAKKDAEIAALKMDLITVNKKLIVSSLLKKYQIGDNVDFQLTSKSLIIEEAAT